MGQFDAAIDDYNSALRFEPKLASALYGRGLAKLRKGDKAGGDTDISTAKAIQADIGDDFMRYGVQYYTKSTKYEALEKNAVSR